MDYVTIPDAFYALTQEENCPLSTPHQRPEGILKSIPEDFIVEEIPAYTASGDGDFLYFLLEKTGMDMVTLLAVMSEVLGVPEKEIGYGVKADRSVRK